MTEKKRKKSDTIVTEQQKPAPNADYRRAPYNLEAEKALLGALFINNDALSYIGDFLKAEHFILPLHGEIFSLISRAIALNKVADPVILKEPLEALKIDDISGFAYAVQLASEATSVSNVLDYARTIYDLFMRRCLILVGEEITETAYNVSLGLSAPQQIEKAEQKLYSLAEIGKTNTGFDHFTTALHKAMEMANAAQKRSSALAGLATHLKSLDGRMGGLQNSDLIILAGRPGMGKTSLATNIAFNIANAFRPAHDKDGVQEGGRVGFFSLEMSSEQLATRILSEQAELPSSKIRRGELKNKEFDRLVQTMARLQELPLFIDQTGGISVGQLMARARRLKRQQGLDILFIDYIQLMTADENARQSRNRVQEITEITTNLKALAKELNIPIVALSQLSRQVESRDNKRPQLSDLRESGSIEQDADIVLFVYREEYYAKMNAPAADTSEHETWLQQMEHIFGKAEVIIAKQRHGPTGMVNLHFNEEFTRFSDLALSEYLPERIG